jgi:DNA polymerase-1
VDSVFAVDVLNMLWRYYHTQPVELPPEERAAGAVERFVRAVPGWQQRAGCTAAVFAFEGGLGRRRLVCPEYKAKPRGVAVDSVAVRGAAGQLRRQLRAAGYRNLFRADGYEADDVLAVVAEACGTCCILSSDKDLYQLLAGKVSILKPDGRTRYTIEDFRTEYGVEPWQWVELRAIAGDPSDGIVGVRGCGTKTAAKWVRGELKADSKAYQTIRDELGVVAVNMKLMRLPVDTGCTVPRIRPDRTGTPAGVKPRGRGGDGFGFKR